MDTAALTRHFELLGIDNAAASEIYTDDAILEYVQSGERIRGRANITASRQAYPGRPTRFAVLRCAALGSLAAVAGAGLSRRVGRAGAGLAERRDDLVGRLGRSRP